MKKTILDRLRYCPDLPTLPAVAIRVIELSNDPESGMPEMCAEISKDPALSAKILRLAHSPIYQTRREATNIRQAISLLGTHAATMIALSFSLMETLRDKKVMAKIDPAHFWRRAMLTALACRALGEHCGAKSPDDFFLAGLMQDIGILVLDVAFADEYEKIDYARLTHEALTQKEKEILKTSHDEVGKWLLESWNLPNYLSLACVAGHTFGENQQNLSQMTACVALSTVIADKFLNPENKDFSPSAHHSKAYLSLSDADLHRAMSLVGERIPEAEKLFEVSILSAMETQAILSEAKNQKMMHELQKVKELERSIKRDALTGAYNRTYLDEVFEREFQFSKAHDWPLSVAMLDLDKFKHVNDEYGHQAGDAVLVTLVHAIQNQLRPDDVFVRYGGEEFVLLLPGTSLRNAMQLLTRLKDTISRVSHSPLEGVVLQVTASIGVASIQMENQPQFEQKEELIAAIDSAMYHAKQNGRNRVEIWNGQAFSAQRRDN